MLLHIIARGRIGRGPEAELVDRYMKRLGWPHKISELSDTGGRWPAPGDTSRTVLLDEGGEQMSSLEFARLLEKWRDSGVRETRFCLGAADGFTPDEREGADKVIAFGRATWPHLMARAMLAEQLWRATSIIAGHPYHREGRQ
ncbi:23S rRNA (pseudouridine(1915)-N(3))-methyltransferase RlmH [Sphingopyxis sp. DHUNG17]|uniref:23S rRNA (pseudouridine(1915)-N(3))-methyltransferase RlmH n=1 Tax=Sphingopyxis TaxID=165697 RepID=UPI00191FC2B7|nr:MULTISPECIES: 23S rRNA (pseudouridine(1915)-N(3))-methyltransferase RlmH [Sphingopyxis]MBL0768444.1 23S rRNA (pseudouridine(1915)-N(3))-methyltransferase RlmH [Sphingopyxis lutea]